METQRIGDDVDGGYPVAPDGEVEHHQQPAQWPQDDEPALASLVPSIAMINVWNRLNVTTRQVAGQAWCYDGAPRRS